MTWNNYTNHTTFRPWVSGTCIFFSHHSFLVHRYHVNAERTSACRCSCNEPWQRKPRLRGKPEPKWSLQRARCVRLGLSKRPVTSYPKAQLLFRWESELLLWRQRVDVLRHRVYSANFVLCFANVFRWQAISEEFSHIRKYGWLNLAILQ